ncbi:uncharacterized protein [Rutidosis leptorrhynchoides]|uniref:uncharacterized protein n=1 Tax=Rutidosis leptorrhynchoides TaxID=125765 RepID=UPI003A994640
MDSAIIPIREIKPELVNFAIRVKVIRMWTQKGYGFDKDKLINELILVDEQGDKIGLTIKNRLRPKFVKKLSEDGNYVIKNLSVATVNKLYKSAHWSHNFKLSCTFNTTVTRVNEWNGQPNRFNFVAFTDIRSMAVDFGVSVDVIGKLSGFGEITPYTKGGQNTYYMKGDLKDIEFVAVHGDEVPLDRYAPALNCSSLTSKTWQSGCTPIGLDELDPSLSGNYIALAKITAIIPDDDWYYVACLKCTRKVKATDDLDELTLDTDGILGREYECRKCGPKPKVNLRFKVQIRVTNDTGSASVWIFEDDVTKFIKPSAYELKKAITPDEETPAELQKLVGKELLFKIEVGDYNLKKNYHVYTVKEVSNDENHLAEYLEEVVGIDQMLPNNDDLDADIDDTSATLDNSVTEDNNVPDAGNVPTVVTPPKKCTKIAVQSTPGSVGSSTSKTKKDLLKNKAVED